MIGAKVYKCYTNYVIGVGMKNIYKDWNLFEILLLSVSLVLISVCFIFTPDKNWFSLMSSLLGVTTVVFTAKGKVAAPFLSLIYSVFYIIISITQQYYGEAIIYGVLMAPLQFITIFNWLKNKNNETSVVKVNKVTVKEYLILTGITLLATVGFYFLLKWLNTAQLVVSTISLITSALATYLLLRRCSNYALFYIVNDIILIVLWGIAMASTGLSILPMIISFSVFLINDVYGFIKWKSREKQEKTIT